MDSELNGFDKRRQPNGELTILLADGSEKKFYTAQCVHCGLMWTVIPGSKRKRGFCYGCNGMLCGGYHCMTNCLYVEAWLEKMESKDRNVLPGDNEWKIKNGIYLPQ